MAYSIPNIGETLRAARLKAGLTQAQLAEQAGVTQAHVSQVEHGSDLRVSRLQQIAAALDLVPVLVPKRATRLVDQVLASLP